MTTFPSSQPRFFSSLLLFTLYRDWAAAKLRAQATRRRRSWHHITIRHTVYPLDPPLNGRGCVCRGVSEGKGVTVWIVTVRVVFGFPPGYPPLDFTLVDSSTWTHGRPCSRDNSLSTHRSLVSMLGARERYYVVEGVGKKTDVT
jgi:hypothetical protein